MPGLRDHEPIVIEQFGGLWARGDPESAPSDHFTQADNVQYFNSGFETRSPIDKYQTTGSPLGHIVRVYNYVMQTGQSLLVLIEGGNIYHVIGPSTVHGPILSIPEMEDFGFVAISGRAYITPFKTYTNSQGVNYELGLEDEFVYVYKGDGTAARKAAGFPPTNDDDSPFIVYNTQTEGIIDKGIHVFAVSFSDGVDDSTGLGTSVFPVLYAPGEQQAIVANLPEGTVGITQRKIWATQAIDPEAWNPDTTTYTYYLVKTVNDNTTKFVTVDFADTDLTVPFVAGTLPNPTSGGITAQNSETDGHCDIGLHIIGVVFETDTGYLSAPGPETFAVQTFVDPTKAVDVANIPISIDPAVIKRHLVSSIAITGYNGDDHGYQMFFIPDGTIDNNVDTTKTVSYYDADLIADASHLMDNFSEIPAGVNLNTYHARMVVVGEFGTEESLEGLPEGVTDNRSVARVSAPGEPEAISKVDGLIIAPLDGNPLTNCQEFRDLLYLFKRTRTIAYSDNNDEPATWSDEIIDQGIGCPVHGIAAVLDSGGVNIDYLLIADWSGLMLFNGTYARPELSWKIEDYWMAMDRNNFRYIQIVNDSLYKKIWITLPTPIRHMMLHADYGEGLDAKNIKWTRWIFDPKISTITLIETNKLIVGALENV